MSICLILAGVLLLGVAPASASTPLDIAGAYHDSIKFERYGRYDAAITALMPVYQRYPHGYTVNLRLGWLFYLEGRYRNSISHYERAVAASPNSVEALLGLSLPYMAERKWGEVEKIMYRILRVDYYNFYANQRLIMALRWQKKYPQAEAVLRKMATLYPANSWLLRQLAVVLCLEGAEKRARAVWRDYTTLVPEKVSAPRCLARP